MSILDYLAAQTVLVVDDTPDNVDILSELLGDKYHVKVALNGKKALEIANSSSPPDLILLDIMMPEMDGFEVCQRLKNQAATKDIPILFISAKTEVEDIVNGFKLGALDYITKPFQPNELLARVKAHLSLRIYNRQILEMQAKLEESNDAKSQIINMVTDQVIPFTMEVLQSSREIQKALKHEEQWMTDDITKGAKKSLGLLKRVAAILK